MFPLMAQNGPQKEAYALYSSLLCTATFMYYFTFMGYTAKELLGVMQRDNTECYATNCFITLTLRQCYQIYFGIHCGIEKCFSFLC